MTEELTTMALTPGERRRCLERIGWSQRDFARVIEWDQRTVRKWFAPNSPIVPAEIDQWLQMSSQFSWPLGREPGAELPEKELSEKDRLALLFEGNDDETD